MGEVWVAKQSEPIKRNVALKLIKAGMDSKSVVLRFEQERQALAMMDHPNIAKVLDGGLTAVRRSFFVMEPVNGSAPPGSESTVSPRSAGAPFQDFPGALMSGEQPLDGGAQLRLARASGVQKESALRGRFG